MNKAEKIMEMVNSGKSFSEVVESGVAKEIYVKNVFTKNSLDWRNVSIGQASMNDNIVIMDEKDDTPDEAIAAILETPAEEPADDIDAAMDRMEEEKKEEAKKAASLDAVKKLAEALGVGDLVANLTAPKPAEKRIDKNKCTRHPDMVVKPGANCEKCLHDSRVMEASMHNRTYVLPCPQCGDAKRQADGGTIKKHVGKGAYACGNCKISYTISGEKCKWGKDDARLFDKSFAKGLY